MAPISRFKLLAAAFLALPALGWAGDEPDEADAGGERPPSIHGRAAPPEDIGRPPAFVASSTGARDCRTRRADLDAHLAFKQQKRVWNALRIATVGASYRLKACRSAQEAFDKAVEFSDRQGAGNAFEKASARVFEAGTSCRSAFDALFARDCAGAEDGACKSAEAERRELAFLDAQNARFSRDLATARARPAALARCKDGASEGGDGALDPAAAPRAKAPLRSKPPFVKPALASAGPSMAVPAVSKAPLKAVTRTPAPRPAPIAPPPTKTSPPPEEKPGLWGSIKGIVSSIADSGRSLVKAAQDRIVKTAQAVKEKAKAAWNWVVDKAKDLRMEAGDLSYRATAAVLNPLRSLVGEGNVARDFLDRVRLESLKRNVRTLNERAQSGNARAVEKLKRLYENDIEREDYQPKEEQRRVKGLALRIAEDELIWSAYMEWLTAGEARQKAVLQKVADYSAGEFGTEQLTLVFKAMRAGLFGYHAYSPELIALNTSEFGRVDEGRFRIVNTPAHETAHGYQHKIAKENPNAGFSLIANIRDQAVIMEANGRHYMSSKTDGSGYFTQPMERHAREVGNEVVRAVHGRAHEERVLAAARKASAQTERD